jgi:hypothetical protein
VQLAGGILPDHVLDPGHTPPTGAATASSNANKSKPHIIEAVLNHVSGHKAGVAGIYNRARYTGEMREALQRWADHLQGICER